MIKLKNVKLVSRQINLLSLRENHISVTNRDMYLASTAVKAVRQKFQLPDGSNLTRHLNHSDKLTALQTPQVQQV